MNPVKNSYIDGVCPDCQEPIPDDVAEGQECSNCTHAFFEEKAKRFTFDVAGGFDIDFPEVLAADGSVVGFTLPDGRTVRLCIALEVEAANPKEATDYKYITSEREMDDLGFRCLDYAHLEFEQITS